MATTARNPDRVAIFRRMSGVRPTGAWLCLALAAAPQLAAQPSVELQVFGGSSASLSLPITITQRGQPDLGFTAHWDTKPFRPTVYYAWRVGLWNGNRGWRFDHTHHKLYLRNPPPEVDEFRITNGFNLLTVSRAFRSGPLTYSLGAGPVVTYPINEVRDQRLAHDRGLGGYLLSGASLLAAVTREFRVSGGLIASLDARASASWVRVPVVNGRATVPNAALHLHAGLGYLFGTR